MLFVYRYVCCLQIRVLFTDMCVVYRYVCCLQVRVLFTDMCVVYRYVYCLQIPMHIIKWLRSHWSCGRPVGGDGRAGLGGGKGSSHRLCKPEFHFVCCALLLYCHIVSILNKMALASPSPE